MIKPSDHPPIISLSSLRERVRRAKDKAQAAGMADIASTLLECNEIFDSLAKEKVFAMLRGKVVWNQFKSEKWVDVSIARTHMVKGKLRTYRVEAVFKDEMLEIGKTINVGDEIACDGFLIRANWGVLLRVRNFEFIKRAEIADGNAVT